MKFALLGHPAAGSLSPVLMNAAYGGRHSYDLVDREKFADAWDVFLHNYDGVNITAPFKLDAFAACRELSENARLTGAVNLVVKDGLRGYNTDVDGVLGALKGLDGLRTCLVVGTGGAARAALAAASSLGLAADVWGRSPEKVSALRSRFGCSRVESPDLIIYTLPGAAPIPELPYASAVVLEAEYRMPQLAGVPCREYIPGVRWLLWQAAAGYSLLAGEEPSFAAMEAAMERILQ